jgi:CHASE3 domain sensor protein
MADPISIALASFSAIKAGVTAGKEIQSLAKDIGSLWDSIDAVKENHQKKKNQPFRTVNEEAMETFIAKKQAEDMENQLREIIIYTRGISAWQELIRLRTQIKKDRQEARRKAIQARRELLEAIGISVLAVAIIALVCVLGYFIWKKQTNV